MTEDFGEYLNGVRLAAMQRVHARGRLVRIKNGEETLEAITVHTIQWYFHTTGFVSALRHLYERCPYGDIRQELSESLFEEETGQVTGTASHLDLYLRWAEALGIDRERLCSEAAILPEMAAIIHWYHYAAMVLDPLEGLAVLSFAAEGHNAAFAGYQGASGIMRDGLMAHYGFSAADVLFWHVHDYADQDHAEVGVRNLVKHARDQERQTRLKATLDLTYDILAGMGGFQDRSVADCWKRSATALYP